MRGCPLLVAAALALAACGVPSSPIEQAEEIASVASEGKLLARDAAQGRTFDTFTRVHAEALEERLRALESKISDPRLGRLLARVAAALDGLVSAPGDRERAAREEQALASAAEVAEGLAR
jgi:hypothetical protein